MDRIKILALVDGKGSRYHRIQLPLERMIGEDIDVHFLETRELTEDMVKNYNVLWVNRLAPVDTVNLSMWVQKYNIKFIIDLDDAIEVGNHINAKLHKLQENVIQRQLVLADLVIVSSLELVDYVTKFNHSVAFIPNFIPFGEGQFEWNGERNNEKMTIGLFGSISHYNDYMSLRNPLKKIFSDKEIQEKCKFVIAADKNNVLWKKVIDLFTHKNIELEIVDLKPVDKYMSLYDNVDIILAPLETTHFNKVKSNLRILEAATREIPVIGSDLYLEKGLNCFIPVKKTGDWYKSIKSFLKNKDYRSLGKEIKRFLVEKYPYTPTVEKRKELLDFVVNKKEESLDDVNIYSIVYNETQYAPFTKYDNSSIRTIQQKSYLFEYNPVINISNNLNDLNGYIGILSHKFIYKTGIYPKILWKILKGKNYQEYDFINLSPQYWRTGRQYLEFSEEQHPGLLERLKELCEVVNLKYVENPTYINFSNFYIMKTEVFNDYVNNYITPAIDYMENNRDRFFIDAQYKGGLLAEELEKYTGLSYYPIMTFVLERLILMYLEDKNLKVLNVI